MNPILSDGKFPMRCRRRQGSWVGNLRDQWWGNLYSYCLSKSSQVSSMWQRCFLPTTSKGSHYAHKATLSRTSLSIPTSVTTSLFDGLLHANYPLPLYVRAIPHRSQTLWNTWAISWAFPSHPPSILKRLPPKHNNACWKKWMGYFFFVFYG